MFHPGLKPPSSKPCFICSTSSVRPSSSGFPGSERSELRAWAQCRAAREIWCDRRSKVEALVKSRISKTPSFESVAMFESVWFWGLLVPFFVVHDGSWFWGTKKRHHILGWFTQDHCNPDRKFIYVAVHIRNRLICFTWFYSTSMIFPVKCPQYASSHRIIGWLSPTECCVPTLGSLGYVTIFTKFDQNDSHIHISYWLYLPSFTVKPLHRHKTWMDGNKW